MLFPWSMVALLIAVAAGLLGVLGFGRCLFASWAAALPSRNKRRAATISDAA